MDGQLSLVVPLLLPLHPKGLPTKAAGCFVGPRARCEGGSVSEEHRGYNKGCHKGYRTAQFIFMIAVMAEDQPVCEFTPRDVYFRT